MKIDPGWMCGRRLLEREITVSSCGRYSLRLWKSQRSDQKNRLVRLPTIQQSLPGYACPHVFLTPHFPRSYPFLVETKRLHSTASLLPPAPRLLLILRHQRERWLSRTVSETQSPTAPRLGVAVLCYLIYINNNASANATDIAGHPWRSKKSARWRTVLIKSNWIRPILDLLNFILEIATIVELGMNGSDNTSWYCEEDVIWS